MSRSIEWAGQKLLLSFDGVEPSPEILIALKSHSVAGVTLYRALNIQNPPQVRALTAALQRAAAQAGQPLLLIATDQEGGQLMAVGEGATPFPGNMALGATRSEDLARRAGEAIGRELAAMGINVNYAPVCDVLADPHNPAVGVRSFGGDPFLVAQMGVALIEGLQSAGVAATAKHFPGLGDTAVDSHFATPVVPHDMERLRRVEFPPFEAAVRAGVKLVMAGHIALPAVSGPRGGLSDAQQQTGNPELPATFSSPILRGLLRQELGFEGVTTSDALDMGPIEQGSWFVIDAIAAAAAGLDLLLFGPTTRGWEAVAAGLAQAARRGLLSAADLEASARRVLALKRWLAGYEQPQLEVVGCTEHQALALEIARQAVTLTRDADGLLPLHLKSEERLLVVLPKPADLTPADTSSYLNLSLAEYMRPYHAAIDELIIPIDPSEAEIAAVHGQASSCAQVIVGTINALDHPGQAALIHMLQESGVPIAVAALRAPFDLLCFPAVPTYICTYSIQPPALRALAEALLGRIPFRGVLPVSIPGV